MVRRANFPVIPGNIDYIDKKSHEIKQDEDKVVYKSLDEIAEDLPDNSPRYILLSHPLTLVREAPLPPASCVGVPLPTSEIRTTIRAPIKDLKEDRSCWEYNDEMPR